MRGVGGIENQVVEPEAAQCTALMSWATTRAQALVKYG
jgi:hypothetical protein